MNVPDPALGRPLKAFVSAGEPSGDQHGTLLLAALRRKTGPLDVRGLGGDGMIGEGLQPLAHVNDLAIMGFTEVLRHIPRLRALRRRCLDLAREWQPDVAVFIDYPGFNLGLAGQMHDLGIPTVAFVAPQVWAWGAGRLPSIKHNYDRILSILPFEPEYFRRQGVNATFVGHPLLDWQPPPESRETWCQRNGLDPAEPFIGLLPGSRPQEMRRLLPVMASALRLLGDPCAVVAAPVGAEARQYQRSLRDSHLRKALVLTEGASGVQRHATLCWVASGTATLETGYIGTPMIVVYRTSPITYLLARAMITVRHIGLVNLVAGEQVAPELIQSHATAYRLARLTDPLWHSPGAEGARAAMHSRLAVIRDRLGPAGAADRAAGEILALIEERCPLPAVPQLGIVPANVA